MMQTFCVHYICITCVLTILFTLWVTLPFSCFRRLWLAQSSHHRRPLHLHRLGPPACPCPLTYNKQGESLVCSIYSTLKYKRKFFILIFVLINLRVYLICWICESAACYSAWVSTHSHALFEMRGKPGCGKISLTIWTHALALLLQGRHTRSGRNSLTEYVHSCKGNWGGFEKLDFS